jgi:hypothetical protein
MTFHHKIRMPHLDGAISPPQPHPRPASVLLDELHVGHLEGGALGGVTLIRSFEPEFDQTTDGFIARLSPLGKAPVVNRLRFLRR